MKKVLFIFALTALSTLQLWGQSEKYTMAMKTAVVALDSATNADEFIAIANMFTRIGSAEPKAWLPGYYASYANLIAGFITNGKDMTKGQGYIDNAQTLLNNAAKLASQPADLSEVAVLQAYIYIGKITEDPMAKGAELSPKIFQELGKAGGLNANNPRAPMLQGLFTLNMPEFYGGGAKNAKPFLEKAQGLYDAATTDGVQPSWGKGQNSDLLKSVGP